MGVEIDKVLKLFCKEAVQPNGRQTEGEEPHKQLDVKEADRFLAKDFCRGLNYFIKVICWGSYYK